jgi:hypothetical protein
MAWSKYLWVENVTKAVAARFNNEEEGIEEAKTAVNTAKGEAETAAKATSEAEVKVEKERAETAEALLAPLASPTLTGTPAVPTAAEATNTTQAASTAFVQTLITKITGAVTSVFGRTGAVVAKSGDYTAAQVGALATGSETVDSENLTIEAVTENKIEEGAVDESKIKNLAVTTSKIANEAVEPTKLQGGATPAYSGKVAITAGKEEEASATERKLVTVTVESKTTEAATFEVLVNKVWLAVLSVGAAVLAPSTPSVTFLLPIGQKYEVKVLTGKAEKIWASVVTI